MIVARSLPLVVWIGFMTYNSLIVVRVIGGTPFQAGLLVAVGNLVFAAGASQIGRIVSLFRGKFNVLVAGNVSLAVGFVGFLFTPSVGLAIPWIALAGAGFGVVLSAYRSHLTEISPEALRGGVIGLSAAGARVTATLTPVAMGLIIDSMNATLGGTLSLQIAGVAAAVIGSGGGLLCLFVTSVSDRPPTDLAGILDG
jgi:MFS family permease